MMMFCQKVTSMIAGNFTFVVVTDRTELDNQISKGFTACGLTNDK
jgi:type I restriction enzyme R subunit